MQLEAKNLGFRYGANGKWLFKELNLIIHSGERIGIVASSGFGKSTLAKLLAGYEKPVEGEILLDGAPLPKRGFSPVQLIYQHPENAINPRWRMKQVLAESNSLENSTSDLLLHNIGIETAWLERFPRELSGGELQRFCIARALSEGTKFLLADEISTMLDVITQAQIWDLILNEVKNRNLGLLVVTHNPALANRVCERVIDLRELVCQ